jgi:hypothetical protein
MSQSDSSAFLGRHNRPFRQRLQQLLESDWRSGALVFSRGGKISRLHYTRLLGVTKSNATPHRDLFEEYEKREGSTNPKTSPRVVAARIWLEAAIAEGTLEVHGGKVSRQQISEAARCALITLSRDVGLATLVAEYDLKVQKMGYRPREQEAKLEEIRTLLSETLLLAPNRMSINRVAVAKAVHMPVAYLNRKPYSDLLEHFDKLLLDDIKNDPTTVMAHGRLYEFAPLWNVDWSDKVAFRVAHAFGRRAEQLADDTAKHVYLAGLNFMRFWGAHENPVFQALKAQLNRGEHLDSRAWEDLAWDWHHRSNDATGGTADTKRSSLNTFIDALSDEGMVPALERRLTRRRGKRAEKHRPTVAEASEVRAGRDNDREFIAFATGLLKDAAARYSIDLDGSDSSGFIETLSTEAQRAGPTALENPSATIMEVLRRRLTLIQKAAQALVDRWRVHYDKGQAHLSTPANIKCWDTLFDIVPQPEYKRAMRELFPLEDYRRNRAIANLLAVARTKFGGLLPSAKAESTAEIGAFFQKRYLELGGFEALDAYLRPHNDAICGTLTDYLVESGSNIAVGRTLFEDAVEDSDLEGYARITGLKARAQGKPIIVDLPEDSRCVSSLRWLKSTTPVLRQRVKTEADRRCLFLVRIGERCQAITEFTFNAWFKRLVGGVPELADLNLTPAMIRPSVLLLRALENDGRIRVGMAIGQHSEQVSAGYQQRGPVRMIYDAQIRDFQNHFETLVIHESRPAAELLGRAQEQVSHDAGRLRATGLGPLCRNHLGRPGYEGKPCPATDCWDDCPQMLFVAEPDDVAALQIWQQSLKRAQGDWERDCPERWETVWLPWLCFSDVVEEKMVRGPLIKAWNAGTTRRQQVEAAPGFVPPVPW